MPLPRAAVLPALLLLAACAETTPPLPPPRELLVVLDQGAGALTVVPVDAPAEASTLPLGIAGGVGLATRGAVAVVPAASPEALAVADLATGDTHVIPLPEGHVPSAATLVNDTLAYVAAPTAGSVVRVNLRTGATATLPLGDAPQGVVFTRGRVFVLNGELDDAGAPLGPSWMVVIDPIANARAGGADSIPLPGPGNAAFAALGGDGLIYVVNRGDPGAGEGRISIVDPVGRAEVANFGGFGTMPGPAAHDGRERLFVSSTTEGLMEFNTRTREVERGAGEAIPIPRNRAVAVDGEGRVYAVDSGPCDGSAPGTVRVLRPDLTELRTITVGACAVAAAVTEIPTE